MSRGRPVIYKTNEEKKTQRRKVAIKAYLKKKNISMEDYQKWKKEKEYEKQIKLVKSWFKQQLEDEKKLKALQLIIANENRNATNCPPPPIASH